MSSMAILKVWMVGFASMAGNAVGQFGLGGSGVMITSGPGGQELHLTALFLFVVLVHQSLMAAPQ